MNTRWLPNIILKSGVFVACGLCLASCATHHASFESAQQERSRLLSGTFGTYDAEPRLPNRRVDTDRLVTELVKVKANTYNFLIHHAPSDWEDLQLFLPKARANKIKVWVTLVPPSEPPFSEPYKLDYQRWGSELAKLSLLEPCLVAWSIDDFSYDAKIFTGDYIKKMVEDSRAINPKLAFVPCLYFKQMKPALVAKYRPFVDGILFPYRHEMAIANLSEWDTLSGEIAAFRSWFPAKPVIVDVYASAHSQLGSSTTEYVRQVMTAGHSQADGVLVFCHQYEDKNPEKYHVIKDFFNQWAAEKESK
ncbi:MAG: hypothetical protein WCS94_03175 [Verrucomicrobiota bacterium]